MIRAAKKYIGFGLSPLPCRNNKVPSVKDWSKYCKEQSNLALFSNNTEAISLAAGFGGLECIDIDTKHDPNNDIHDRLFSRIKSVMGEGFFRHLFIQKTPSGGRHIIYLCDNPQGNSKLALNKDKLCVIETRGMGGHFLVAPSKGYEFLQYSKLGLPHISKEERRKLLDICKSFDETPIVRKKTKFENNTEYKDIIQQFNSQHYALDFFESEGWDVIAERPNEIHLRRPSGDGVGAVYYEDSNSVYVFTSNSEYCGKQMDAWQCFLDMRHTGNISEAVKYAKIKLGIENKVETKPKSDNKSKFDALFEERFDLINKPPNIEYVLKYEGTGIAPFGSLIGIVGAAKSSKSAIATTILSSAINTTDMHLGFELDVKNRPIVHLDTEQTAQDMYKVTGRMLHQAGLSRQDIPNYYPYRIRKLSRNDRLEYIKYLFNKIPNMGVLLIDGIVDLCNNYNDLQESQQVIDLIVELCEKHNTLGISVLHTARSTGAARGHLGAELENKSIAIMSVSKQVDDNPFESPDFKVKFTHLRSGHISPFSFYYEDNKIKKTC